MPSQALSLIPLPFFLRLLFCFIPVKRSIVLLSDHDSRWKFVRQFFLKLTKRCPRQKRGRGRGNCTRGRHIFNLVGGMINSTDEIYWGRRRGRWNYARISNLKSWRSIFFSFFVDLSSLYYQIRIKIEKLFSLFSGQIILIFFILYIYQDCFIAITALRISIDYKFYYKYLFIMIDYWMIDYFLFSTNCYIL